MAQSGWVTCLKTFSSWKGKLAIGPSRLVPLLWIRGVHFACLCSAVGHSLGNPVTSKLPGYQNPKVNSSVPLERPQDIWWHSLNCRPSTKHIGKYRAVDGVGLPDIFIYDSGHAELWSLFRRNNQWTNFILHLVQTYSTSKETKSCIILKESLDTVCFSFLGILWSVFWCRICGSDKTFCSGGQNQIGS